MTRKELERKYEERGIKDYQLCTLQDLKAIHGIDVPKLSGYQELSEEHRELFDRTVIRFFNAWGLDNRKALKPECVHYVCEVTYEKTISDDEIMDIGKEIFIADSETGAKKRRLHRYVFEKGIPFKECEKSVKYYLRFELKGVWFHITEDGKWY